MKINQCVIGLLIVTLFAISFALGPNELPFGAYDLGQYNSTEASRLADSLGFNLWVEYRNKLSSDNILLLASKGIASIRGGLIDLGNYQYNAEAPFKYSWSNYGLIDVAFPYPNSEVRMVPFSGDTTTNDSMWISHRNTQNICDTLSGISTYLDRFDNPKSHVVFGSHYYFKFPGEGWKTYQVEISARVDSICDTNDIVAYVQYELGQWNKAAGQYPCKNHIEPLGTIKASKFEQANTFKSISFSFMFPDSITYYVKDANNQCTVAVTYTNIDTAYYCDLTLTIIATGKREFAVNKIKIYDQYGIDLIENQRYDTLINQQLATYDTPLLRDNIYAWMLMDEPHWSNLQPFYYIRGLVKQTYTNWRIWTFFDKYWALQKSYLSITGEDAVTNDIYPFGINSPYANPGFQTNGPLENLNSCLWAANYHAKKLGKEFWFTPQAFRDNDSWRYPTPSELSCETFMGLCWGAKGIIYYKYDTGSPTDYQEFGIRHDGIPTNLYDVIRDRIGPYIRAIGPTYMTLHWLRSFPLYPYEGPGAPGGSYVRSIAPWDPMGFYGQKYPDYGWFHVGEYNGPTGDNSKYFMIVNRNCSRGANNPVEAPPIPRACVFLDAETMNLGTQVYISGATGGTRTYSTTLPIEDFIPYTIRPPLKAGEGRLYKVRSAQRIDLFGRVETDLIYQGALDITGDVTIPRGETLRIEGPAELTVKDNYSIMLEPGASFIAEGFDSNLVTITPFKKEWGAIAMAGGSSIYLDYCQLNGDFKGIEANSENFITIKNSTFTNTVNLIDAIGSVSVRIDSCIFQGSSSSGITLSYPESVWINGNQFIDNGLYAMCIVGPAKCCTVQFNQISEPQEYGIKYFGSEINAVFSGNQINGYSGYQPIAGIYVGSDPKSGDPIVTIQGGNINFFDVGIQLEGTVEGTLVGSGVHCDSNYKYGIALDKAYADLLGMGEPGGPNTFNHNGIDGLYATSSSGTIRKNHLDYNDYTGAEVFDCNMVFGDSIDEGDNSLGDGSAYGLLAYGEPISAIMNWWGTDDGDKIKSMVTELVSYDPFLTSPLNYKRNVHKDELPSSFELSQVYPNPFNLTAKIDYAIPVESHITLKIYNILGQEINELINQEVQPGYYSVVWNGTDRFGSPVSSGVYLYSLKTPDKVITKKMVMLK